MKTLTPGTVFDPAFQTSVGALEAGTAFALAIPGRPPLLITCQHLFGPAGGLSKDVPPEFMSRFVEGVVVTDLVDKTTARGGAALSIPNVDADDPAHDLAAFVLDPSPTLAPLPLGAVPAENAPVMLASRLRKGGTPGVFLHPARYVGDVGDGTTMIAFDDPTIHLPGASGAPVVTESGQFVGMVVRFKQPSPATTVAMLLPAATIHTYLIATEIPEPVKPKGFLKRLLGR